MQIKRTLASVAATGLLIATMAMPALAAAFTLTPWTYDPGNTGGVQSTYSNGQLYLAKNVPTATNAAAGASIDGVNGLSTTGMTLSFDYSGYCGAGSPRFNVYLSNGQTIFLGCAYGGGPTGTNVTGTATFTAGNTYGGVLFPTGETVTGIDIVQDEQGQVTLSNITVNGTMVTVSANSLKDQCKKGGYQSFDGSNGVGPFKNQGQCVSFFAQQQH
jgi:hypothetical protein